MDRLSFFLSAACPCDSCHPAEIFACQLLGHASHGWQDWLVIRGNEAPVHPMCRRYKLPPTFGMPPGIDDCLVRPCWLGWLARSLQAPCTECVAY
jgi:hypothetical protein